MRALTRQVGLLAAGALTLGLAACSSDAPAKDTVPASSTTPTPDASAADEADVVTVYEQFNDATVTARLKGKADPKLFAGIADGPFVEAFIKSVRDEAAIDVTRRGGPTIDQYEATVTGDTAKVLACLDEDKWKIYGGGTRIKTPKNGPVPIGAMVERRTDGWVLVDQLVSADLSKECT